jgi:hypothetical protein
MITRVVVERNDATTRELRETCSLQYILDGEDSVKRSSSPHDVNFLHDTHHFNFLRFGMGAIHIFLEYILYQFFHSSRTATASTVNLTVRGRTHDLALDQRSVHAF